MPSLIRCIKQACFKEGINFVHSKKNPAVIRLQFGQFEHIIVNTKLGIISDAVWELFRDKWYTYSAYNTYINMPKTISYVDPMVRSQYQAYASADIERCVADIVQHFSFPVVIKSNHGTQKQNVFICHNELNIYSSLSTIWNQHSWLYDHVALAQQYIPVKREYRVIIFLSKPVLIYPKLPSNSKSISSQTSRSIVNVVNQLMSRVNIEYAGLDILEDNNSKLWLLEINGSPVYSGFIRDHGDDEVVKLMQQVISHLNVRYRARL